MSHQLPPMWTLVSLVGRGVQSPQTIHGQPIRTIKMDKKWPQWEDVTEAIHQATLGVNQTVYAVCHDDQYTGVSAVYWVNGNTLEQIEADEFTEAFSFTPDDAVELSRLSVVD